MNPFRFPTTDPIGKRVKIGYDEFTVVGTFKERKTLFGSLGENFALIPVSTYMITTPIAAILTAISSIGLLVGGIGVMNMMLVSVTERTTEIGIRKALGATWRDILLQFLIEAGTLTGIGGIIGISVGLGGAIAVSALTGLPSQLSLPYILLGVEFSVSIGLFFGIYPANRAAKLDPVRAMSYAK